MSIQPLVQVFPMQYQTGQTGNMVVSVTNASKTSTQKLNNDDTWTFTFEQPWGGTINVNPKVFVNSTVLTPADFKITAKKKPVAFVRIQYSKPPKAFPPGDAFSFSLDFQAPNALGTGKVLATGPGASSRISATAPWVTTIAFMNLPIPPVIEDPDEPEVVVGPPGPEGPPGPAGPPGSASRVNFLQVAAQRWHDAGQGHEVNLPGEPTALAFDGRHVWVVMQNATGSPLARVIPSTGEVVEVGITFPPGRSMPSLEMDAIVWTGGQLWISGRMGSGNPGIGCLVVSPEGVWIADVDQQCFPRAMVFDGLGVWFGMGNISRWLVAAPQVRAAGANVPGQIFGMAFDGAKVWIAASSGIRIIAPNGPFAPPGVSTTTPTQPLGFVPGGLAYDGQNMWVSDPAHGTLMKLDTAGNPVAPAHPAGVHPQRIIFDGAHLWAISPAGETIAKLRAADGSLIGLFPSGEDPVDLVFDGISVWVANKRSRKLSRR